MLFHSSNLVDGVHVCFFTFIIYVQFGGLSQYSLSFSLSLSLSQASTKECYSLYFHNICWRTSSWRVWGRNKIASFLVAFACNFASIFEHELWFRNRKFSSFVFGSVFLFLLICFFFFFGLILFSFIFSSDSSEVFVGCATNNNEKRIHNVPNVKIFYNVTLLLMLRHKEMSFLAPLST